MHLKLTQRHQTYKYIYLIFLYAFMLLRYYTRHLSTTPKMPHPHLRGLFVNQCQTLNFVLNTSPFYSIHGPYFLSNKEIQTVPTNNQKAPVILNRILDFNYFFFFILMIMLCLNSSIVLKPKVNPCYQSRINAV